MEWCDVSKVTACAWKKGTRKPSRRSVKLFSLYAQGKVITREFDGWKFNSRTGALVFPEGNEFTPGMIRTLPLLHQQVAALNVEKRLIEAEKLSLEYGRQKVTYLTKPG